jgi:hypothetical protein
MRSILQQGGIVLALAACALWTSPAVAGIADSPIPNIGAGSALIYTTTGVQQNDGLIGSAFMCTSTASSSITIAVEIFAPAGGSPLNDVTTGNGRATISPGQTFTFGTGGSGFAGVFTDQQIAGLGGVQNGSARVISTSSKLICTAMVADKVMSPPNSMTTLPMILKLKQKGN